MTNLYFSGCRVVSGGWISWNYNQLSQAKAEAETECGNTHDWSNTNAQSFEYGVETLKGFLNCFTLEQLFYLAFWENINSITLGQFDFK